MTKASTDRTKRNGKGAPGTGRKPISYAGFIQESGCNFEEALKNLDRKLNKLPKTISRRERKLIEFIAKGYSTEEISKIMRVDISELEIADLMEIIRIEIVEAPANNIQTPEFENTSNLLHNEIVKPIEKINKILSQWNDDKIKSLLSLFETGKINEIISGQTIISQPVDDSISIGYETYEGRPNKKEDAPSFIQRVYGGRLTGEFTRADLRRIDPSAEAGLRNWESTRKQRAPINLPTKQEVNDRLLASGAAIETNDARETARRRAAAWRRTQTR